MFHKVLFWKRNTWRQKNCWESLPKSLRRFLRFARYCCLLILTFKSNLLVYHTFISYWLVFRFCLGGRVRFPGEVHWLAGSVWRSPLPFASLFIQSTNFPFLMFCSVFLFALPFSSFPQSWFALLISIALASCPRTTKITNKLSL